MKYTRLKIAMWLGTANQPNSAATVNFFIESAPIFKHWTDLSAYAWVKLGVHDLQLGADNLELGKDFWKNSDTSGRKIVRTSESLKPETSVEDAAPFQAHPVKNKMKNNLSFLRLFSVTRCWNEK